MKTLVKRAAGIALASWVLTQIVLCSTLPLWVGLHPLLLMFLHITISLVISTVLVLLRVGSRKEM